MKKILFITTVLFCFFACEKDETMVMVSSDPAAAVISSHANGDSQIIEEGTLGDNVTFTWAKADYGVATQITYTLKLDSAGRSIAHAIVLGTTQENSLTISVDDLNQKLLNDLRVSPNVPSALELRVTSALNEKMEKISPVVSVNITPYKKIAPSAPATLWVPGGYQGWNPGAAPVIYALNETQYEGFVYIKEGTGFKFTSAPDWDHINYGDSGTPGVLTTDGLANGLSAGEEGYYRFKVDVGALTYEMYDVHSFGLIGTATTGGWGSSTAMEYDKETDKWTITTDLTSGALKFRANDSWDVNYGPEDGNALEGNLTQTDGAISIAEPGNYTVTLDFSRSVAPWKYRYTVVKNSDTTPPVVTQLWLPGAYQGWSPSTAPVIYSTSASTFEGFVYMESAGEFKFTSAGDWDHTNYGFAEDGKLTTDGTAGNLSVPDAGVYRFKVDTENLTYEFYHVDSFGVIGTATPGGWDNSTEMDFDIQSGLWSVTLDLVNGALKFRANNSWDVNYGPFDSNALDGKLIGTDAAITIPENGNYTVTIDMTRSNDAHEYRYTVVKN